MFARRLICLWIGAFGLAAGAFCQTYVGINLGGSTFPISINGAGVIAGYYLRIGVPQAFVRDTAGTITEFSVPGSTGFTEPSSINAAGAITGDSSFGGSGGFVRDPAGHFISFVADKGLTYPQSINAGGAVTGYYAARPSGLINHGFLRADNGAITSFDPPGSTSTTALSINDVGAITGHYQSADGSVHGFVRYPTGHITSFDPPGSTGTYPAGINYSGAITGYYTRADGRQHGFVRDAAGEITLFDGVPTSINNLGAIVGAGFLRSPDGTITSLMAPACGPPTLNIPSVATSINDAGVIAGYCGGRPLIVNGWVRYP
jgi:hypothetical protein